MQHSIEKKIFKNKRHPQNVVVFFIFKLEGGEFEKKMFVPAQIL